MSSKLQVVLLSQTGTANFSPSRDPACIHAKVEGDKLSLRRLGDGGKVADIALPRSAFSLNHALASNKLEAWISVIDRLYEAAGPELFVIADIAHPLRELLLIADRRRDFRYGLYFQNTFPRVSVLDYALLGCSQLNVFETDDIEADFKKKYVGPYQAARPYDDFASLLPEKPAADHGANVDGARSADAQEIRAPARADGHPTRLLIVSYFSGPCRSVGVQRINYWIEELERLSKGRVEAHLATAIDWSDPDIKVHHVPDRHMATLLDGDAAFFDWAHDFVKTEQRNAKSFNTLSYYWRYALERYFDAVDQHFDVVLISGNPFAVFDFAVYAKRRWRARTILDYRDPFTNNPRMKFSPKAREAARYVEKGYNLQADLAFVVNEHCANLLVANEDIKTVIVPNGFDERQLRHISHTPSDGDIIKIVHAGQFYSYGTSEHLLSALSPDKHEFHHVGEPAGIPETALASSAFIAHGRKPYDETLRIVSQCDCGVVFLSEENFETTTKVFDYLATGIDILVCTAGEPRQGVLAEMLQGREGVYWSRNARADLEEFILNYRPTRHPDRLRAFAKRFSRRSSTETLLEHVIGADDPQS